MNLTHNGKIGCLPKAIQEQLNHRIENGEKGRGLVEWLNSLPEVQAVMAREFGGKPVRQQNISEWRKHGYVKWLRQQEALDMARQLADDVGELQPAGAPPLADQMVVWLTARYLVAVQKLAEKNNDGELDLKVLRELCHDVVALRRGDHSGARLKMEQERLDRDRVKTEEEVIAHFQRWLKNPEVRDLVCQNYVSPEERERRMRDIFGLEPKPAKTDEEMAGQTAGKIRNIYGLPQEPPEAAAPTGVESNPVKLGQTKSDPIQSNQTNLPDGHIPSDENHETPA